MDFNMNNITADKYKKNIALKALLSSPKTDKKDLKKFLLENFIIIPQEDRLAVWKLFLDIPIKSNDPLYDSHYLYLKHIVKDVLQVAAKDDIYMNYHIYLLDNGQLPLNEVKSSNRIPFYILYKQIVEIVDDANESDYYYLTVRLLEYLAKNLNNMKSELCEYFCKKTDSNNNSSNSNNNVFVKSIIEHDSIKLYFLTAFAFKFHNLINYLIILDRFVLDSYEIIVYVLIIVIERILRDNQLVVSVLDSIDYLIDEQLGLDESRIKKGIEKLSKLLSTSSSSSSSLPSTLVK